MGNNRKSLAKVLGPAVLLTAALALPIESLAFAAPAPGFAAVKVDKENRGKQKHQRQVNRGQARRQQVQAQRQQVRQQHVRQQRQEVRQQRVAAQQRAQIRQQRIDNQRQAQIRQQRIENQRLAQIRQQQIASQRQAEIRRQRDLQIARDRAAARRYNNDRYAYDNRYNQNRYNQNRYRGRGGADRSVIAADGILYDNGRCLVLRGHQGQTYSLVGGTGGLREGEHVRLVGRLLYDDDGCGEMMDVHQVQAIWADPNHRQTYFDHQRDGSFNNSYRQRYGDRYYDRYEDDYRYDDYYYDEDYPR